MGIVKRCLGMLGLLLCVVGKSVAQTPTNIDNYTYQHSWNYAVGQDSMFCSEDGTMDFFENGTALDHALQRYELHRVDGSRVVWYFDYYSPSFWRLDGDNFYFRGEEQTFSMTLLSDTNAAKGLAPAEYKEYAQRIIANVSRSIGHETCFKVADLSDCRLVWSYTYSDGHTDTWEFVRKR